MTLKDDILEIVYKHLPGQHDQESHGRDNIGVQEEPGGRAPKGGITGINGEYYPGGTFLPNTTNPKMMPDERKRAKIGAKKVEIEPYKYDVPPTPDHRSIFRYVGGTVATYDRSAGTLTKINNKVTLDYFAPNGKIAGIDLDDLIVQYNNGMRWFIPGGSKK